MFYRIGARQRRLTLGTYPAMSLAEVREAWREARQDVARGRDPARTREHKTGATDFRTVCEDWLRRDQGKNRSRDIVARTFERDVLPAWQYRQITDIGRRDVLDVIDAVVDRGAVIAARRLHALVHRLFKWAMGRGIIDANPAAALPKPGTETTRDRVLTEDELVAVWKGAEQLGGPFGSVVRLLILTASRRDEIAGLKWSEIDGGADVMLDGTRTKTGQPHSVPLSIPARSIIASLPRLAGSEFVFTIHGNKPISGWSQAKAKLDKFAGIAPWRIHDLRRTAATGLQKLKTPLQVTEAILGHTAGSRAGIVGVYQRHDYADEKRAALEAWGAHVKELVA